MAELTYSQALASIRDIKADFQSDTNIQAVKEYASTRSATYSSLMEQDSFTALDQSVRSGFKAVFQPVKEAGQIILDTANYALGNPLSTIDKAIGMPSQPAEDLEEIDLVDEDLIGGDLVDEDLEGEDLVDEDLEGEDNLLLLFEEEKDDFLLDFMEEF